MRHSAHSYACDSRPNRGKLFTRCFKTSRSQMNLARLTVVRAVDSKLCAGEAMMKSAKCASGKMMVRMITMRMKYAEGQAEFFA